MRAVLAGIFVVILIVTGLVVGVGAAMVGVGSGGAGDDTSMLGVGPFNDGEIPARYRATFTAAAARCPDMPAAMLAAQIEAESQWKPTARSSKSAQGIAQIMPGTWETAGRDHNGDGKADPLDPADALPVMATINCDNLRQVDAALAKGTIRGDRYQLALAAYNAGFNAVTEHGGVPPYAETQGYVRKITDNLDKYSVARAAPASPGGGNPAIVQAARTYLGIPYVWGGQSRLGLDCSGLVLRVVRETTGKSLPHLADAQARSGSGADVPANLEAMTPGDIVAFSTSRGGNYHHIGVYIGGGKMIHAPQTGDVVKISDISSGYWGQGKMTWKVKRF